MILQGKEYNEKRMEIESAKVKQLERELADMTADRDSWREDAVAWDNELKDAIRERDEARKCLREAITYRNKDASGYDLDEWLKAAGMEEQ